MLFLCRTHVIFSIPDSLSAADDGKGIQVQDRSGRSDEDPNIQVGQWSDSIFVGKRQ